VIYAPRVGLLGAEIGGQVLLFAIEQPDDDTQLIVGMEKANAPPAHRQPSTGKCTRSRVAAREVWCGRRDHDAPRLTIRQRHERYRADRDHRIANYEEPAQTRVPQTRRSTFG
jgi:hypothetical protein